MITCYLCNKLFAASCSGLLTRHLLQIHNTSFIDYVIITEYEGIEPKCICGWCTERPLFIRGKFSKYALNHNTFKFREQAYRNKFGDPTCKECNTPVRFHRGIPQVYCSFRCVGLNNGFSKPETQEKIRKSIKAKYGVDNISQIPEVKEKQRTARVHRIYRPYSEERKNQISKASKAMWRREGFREKIIPKLRHGIRNNPKEMERRRTYQKERMQDPEYKDTVFRQSNGCLSKLHQRIRKQLSLTELGFVPEQRINRYYVDELNKSKKLILEINGDYTHANPKFYLPEAKILLPGQSFSAKEKWNKDKKRKETLISLGYRVLVIWESDDLEIVKLQLEGLLSEAA